MARHARYMRKFASLPQISSPRHPRSNAASRRGREFWDRTDESGCFHIDGVCNWKDGWFYGPDEGEAYGYYYQPTATLLGTVSEDIDILDWNDLNDFDVDERIQFNISHDSRDTYDDVACSFSSTPIHLVAQSAYNDMMGEFYTRTIRGLNRWMRDYYPRGSEDDVRIYVHFVERHDILEGHRLFLGGLPNDNRFESFLALMPRNDTCRCFRKLVLCGYRMENVTAFRSDNNSKIFPDDPHRCNPTFKERLRGKVDLNDPNGIVFKPETIIPNPKTDCDECRDIAYRELRSDLMKSHSMRYQNLDDKIRLHRRRILIELGLIGNDIIDADGWKLVGLARRKSRRLWLNIDDIMSMCKEYFGRHRVACILVDVEEAQSPEEQLIMHRSLHAFIGVHGAQLTQGVLLPRHGYILELLPWIPPYTLGGWTASTDGPTPLGEIFHNTDINHYGYSLSRESTPLCSHVDIMYEEGTRLCLTNQENEGRFNWDVRDFIVPTEHYYHNRRRHRW
ncbi:hypothetical protein ACHAXA_006787 [Cyclostephanos tholiformis]|uniref:Uncharacterized protein n=1 Tax=Cyclostephanos tholiformis TaxID=382380 RepID=A0ABD3RHJ6_9STRA